jgi:hypothetical protein
VSETRESDARAYFHIGMDYEIRVGLEELTEDVMPGRDGRCLACAKESRNRWIPKQATERTGIIHFLAEGLILRVQPIAGWQRTSLEETFSEKAEPPFHAGPGNVGQTVGISDHSSVYEPGDAEAGENAHRSAEGERISPFAIRHEQLCGKG